MSYRDHFQEMEVLRRELDHIFDGLTTWRLPFSRISFLPGQAARRYPLVNIHEDKDTYYVEALAPGVKPETIDISVVGNTLTMAGEKNTADDKAKPESYHRNERAIGKFMRTVELPNEVDETRVKAGYKNGLLLVTLPKAEKAKPKQISVNVV